MDKTILLDRAVGSILGAAVGDALGATLEFTKLGSRSEPLREMVGGGWLNLDPGEVTDDTQQIICLLESIVLSRGWDSQDFGRRLLDWEEGALDWQRGFPKDIGMTTLQALGRLDRKSRLVYGGTTLGDSNGSVMRTAPIGLLYPPGRLLRKAGKDCSRITHGGPSAIRSCQIVSGWISRSVRGEHLEPDIETRSWLMESRAFSGSAVLSTLLAYEALERNHSFEEGVVRVANLGGDADTNASVVGAVLGSIYGTQAIPPRWLSVLQHRDLLIDLTEKVVKIAATSHP